MKSNILHVVLAAVGLAQATPWIGVALGGGGSHGGVLIREAMPDSPGERAGLKAGDEIVAFDGQPVRTAEELVGRVKAAGIGHKAELRVFAGDGRARTVRLALAARPDQVQLQRAQLVGKRAPDFALEVVRGDGPASLAALRGNVLVLDFFATWCGPCMRAIPRLSKLSSVIRGNGGRVLSISSEAPDVIRSALTRHHVDYLVARDPDEAVSRRYHVFAIPTVVIVGRDGLVRDVVVGDITEAEEAVLRAVTDR